MGAAEPRPLIRPIEVRDRETELIWRCTSCGHWWSRAVTLPERCPDCDAPREFFESVVED